MTDHDAKILSDLEVMARAPDNGFWPQALAQGALRMIRDREAALVCGEQHSYMPTTEHDARTWEPHRWVIA